MITGTFHSSDVLDVAREVSESFCLRRWYRASILGNYHGGSPPVCLQKDHKPL